MGSLVNCVKALTGGLPTLTGSQTGSFRARFSDGNPPVLLVLAFCGFLIYQLCSHVFVYVLCVCSALWNAQNPASLDNLDNYIILNTFNFIHQDLWTFTYLKGDGQQWPRLSVKCLVCERSVSYCCYSSFSRSPLLFPASPHLLLPSSPPPTQLFSAPKALVFHSGGVLR